MKVGPSVTLVPIMRGASASEKECAEKNFLYIKNLANIEPITFIEKDASLPPCASKPLRKAEVLIPMKDLINKDEEIKRLKGMIAKLEGNIKGGEAKLSNEAFVSKAPAKIIEGARAQLELNKTQLSKVKAQLEQMMSL